MGCDMNKTWKAYGLIWPLFIFMLLALSGPAIAATYTPIDCPDSISGSAYKINDRGDIVGTCSDANGFHAYRLRNGIFKLIDFPGARGTTGSGINNLGHIAGFYFDDAGAHGYVLRNGRFKTIQVPGSVGTAVGTRIFDINDLGTMVGYYENRDGAIRGFVLDSSGFRDIVFPNAERTAAYSIDVLGRISGAYLDVDGIPHGFYLKNGDFATIHPPGAVGAGGTGVTKTGANIQGHIVGAWTDNPDCPDCLGDKAFLFNNRKYINLRFPGAIETSANGINAAGQIVGQYKGADEKTHGYVRMPAPEFPTVEEINAEQTLQVPQKNP
jgi:uncharacterized membrane protein